jgi:hypothetical protein
MDAVEHLTRPTEKLFAIERLLDIVGSAAGGRVGLPTEVVSPAMFRGEAESAFYCGLGAILSDIRLELQAIAVADFDRTTEDDPAAQEPQMAGAR